MVSKEICRIKLLSERIYQHIATLKEMQEFNHLLEKYQKSAAEQWIQEFTRDDPL